MKTRIPAAAAIVAISCVLAACSGPTADCVPQVVTMPEAKATELTRLLNEYDPAAFGKVLTENARLLPPNVAAIEGRAAILDYYSGIIGETIRYEATPLTQVTVGNVGLAEGTYRVKNLKDDTYVEMGKYLSVWVKEGDEWKIARLMSNADYQTPRTSVDVQPADPAPTPSN